jgi:hypothetical protein
LGGLLLVVTFMMVVATTADQLEIPLPAPVLSLMCLGLGGAAAIRWGHLGGSASRVGDRVVWGAAGVGAALCLPKLLGEPAAHISRLVYGYDNVHHVRMAFATAHERGYFWSADGVDGLYGPGGGYRPGTSLVATYVPWTLRGGYSPPSFTEVVAGAEATYSLLMVVLTFACLLLLRELAWHPRLSAARGVLASGVAATLLVLLGFAPVVTQRGFQAQSLATTSALVGLVMLSQRRAGLSAGGRLLLGSCAVLVAMHAWPLAAVPLAVAVTFASLREWRAIPASTWVGAVLLALLAGYPIYGRPRLLGSGVVIPSDTAFLSSTSPAVLPLPATTWFAALVCAVLVAVLRRRLGLDRWTTKVTTVGCVGALLATALVGGAQVYNGQGLGGYYLQKTLYLTTLIGFVAAAGILCRAVSVRRLPHRPAVLAGLSLVLLMMWAPLATPWAVTHLTNRDPNLLDMTAVQAALDMASSRSSPDRDVVVTGSCEDITSHYTTGWTGTVLRSWNPDRETFVRRLQLEGESLAALVEYAQADATRSLTVYALATCPLTDQIRRAALPNVRLVAHR